MQQQNIEIINKLGLHARASAKITQLANQYKSDITFVRDGKRVNAKSIMGVMMLAAARGANVGIEVDGPDESQAMQALLDLINNRFGENE
jgi:phosphocarrier protein HPr